MTNVLRPLSRAIWHRAFTPPERLSVAQWADAYRYLSPESASVAADGPTLWRTDHVPYLRGVMDALSDPAIHEVVFAKSAQVGGSSCGENWLGWIIDQRPSPSLMVWPTEKKLKAFSLQRLDPMIRDTPRLREVIRTEGGRRDSHDTMYLKQFPGGFLQNLTAKSSADLRSTSARYVDCEEVDEWESDLQDQGDPLGMVRARVIAFPDYKLYYVSTPILDGHSRIWPLLESSTSCRYHVPCPHCNAAIVFRWKDDDGRMRFRFARDEHEAPIVESVVYDCPACNQGIAPAHRDAMVAAGAWIPQYPGRPRAGFHIWSAYSPFVPWATLLQEWWSATKDPQLTKTFTNLWLGLPHKEAGHEIEPHFLRARAEPYPISADGELLLPNGVGLLTAGVDVQVDRLEFFLEGWGAGEENWKMLSLSFEGDPGQDEVWGLLAHDLLRAWTHQSGQAAVIASMAVDAGYQSERVHRFCDAFRARGAFATIGKDGRSRPILQEPGRLRFAKGRRQSRPTYMIGVDPAKDLIMSALRIKAPGPLYVHFPTAFDEVYCMSFRRIVEAIDRGYLYAQGDYLLDDQSGEKVYHKVHLADRRHLCGKVVFPSASTAEVRLLVDGNVVPYIRFAPATAFGVLPAVIFTEIDYVTPPTPPATRRNRHP